MRVTDKAPRRLLALGILVTLLATLAYASIGMLAALFVPMCQEPSGWSSEPRCRTILFEAWAAIAGGGVGLALMSVGVALGARRFFAQRASRRRQA